MKLEADPYRADFTKDIHPSCTFQTINGGQFTIDRPRLRDIDLRAIAVVLSRIPRFGGHTNRFYSVAEHSIHVCNLVPAEYKREALLHDAHEAYSGFGDVCSPAKQLFPGLYHLELEIDAAICNRFGIELSKMRSDAVKKADLQMLANERAFLLPPSPFDWGIVLPEPDRAMGSEFLIHFDPDSTAKAFFALAHSLGMS